MYITIKNENGELTREYAPNEQTDWNLVVESMLDTLTKSKEERF